MTPEQYVQNQILEYPSLYACSSFEESKFRIFDQLFNAIGNGISSKTFKKIVEDDFVLSEQDIEKLKEYTSTDDFAYGYTEDQLVEWNGQKVPNMYIGTTFIIVPQSKQEQYPHIAHWVPFSSNHRYQMHSNFDKEYSLCWDGKYTKYLNKEWIESLIWFYEKCHDLFNKENIAEYYSSAFPETTEKKTQIRIRDFLSFIKDYSNEKVSKEYGLEYYGDPDEFLRRRWNIEKIRIIKFIEKTLKKLNKKLNE